MTNLVLILLRCYLTTNSFAGSLGGSPSTPITDGNGNIVGSFQTADLLLRPPHIEVITNYVVGVQRGTNVVELMTLRSR